MLSQHRALQFAIAAGATSFAIIAVAQAPNPALSVKKVRDKLYVAQSGGGNSSIIIGQSGVIVVDAKTNKQTKIAALVEEGKSLNEVKQALGETSKPANAPPFPPSTETTYEELAQK